MKIYDRRITHCDLENYFREISFGESTVIHNSHSWFYDYFPHRLPFVWNQERHRYTIFYALRYLDQSMPEC